jgi:hypothetical protein
MSSMAFVDNSAQIFAQAESKFSDSDFISAAGPFGGDAASAFLASSSAAKADPPAELAKPADAAAAPAAPAAEGAKEGEAAAGGEEGKEEAPKPPPREKNIYEKAGVHHYEQGHKVYGHPVFKGMMDKYLPYHADLDDGVKWVQGWHMIHPVDYNNWDDDQVQGAMTATEGYYPRKEEEDERKWAELTNASEHNSANSLERAKAAFLAAEEAKAAAAGEEGKAEGDAAAADGAAVADAPAADAPAAALTQKSVFDATANYNILSQGHVNADNGAAGDVDSSEFDEDKAMEEAMTHHL